MTKISAIGAICLIGEKRDLSLLAKLAESNDIRLKKATEAAIEKITRRISQN